MAAENTTGFMIDGNLYEVPDMGSFNMDEAQTLYDYSGLSLEDFVQPDDETEDETKERERKLRNPGFLRALMHIAYQRGNPTERPTKVKALIGAANIVTALGSLSGDEPDPEDDGLPGIDDRARAIIAERFDRQRRLQEAEYRAAWDEFNNRFGRTGQPAHTYWGYEIGHILHLGPLELGPVRPFDLLGAVNLFDTLYRQSSD